MYSPAGNAVGVVAGEFDRQVHCLLGLPFDAVSMADAVQRIRGAAETRQPCFLSTPNLNFLIACQSDTAFRDSVINSGLSVADGMPLVWLAKLLGMPIMERVAGSEIFEHLRQDSMRPISVFFFGGMPGVAEEACRRLNEDTAGIRCTGFHDPGFGSVEEMSSQATIDKINASTPDFVVVSLGARKGQAWIERNRRRLSAPVISHLGAVVNFVAGTVSRAPAWMQRTGLEWLWRIKEEPALWRRYLGDGLMLIRLLFTRVLPLLFMPRQRSPATSEAEKPQVISVWEAGTLRLSLRGNWTADRLAPLRKCLRELTERGGGVRLDLDQVASVDSAFLGLLLLVYGHQRQLGCEFRLTGVKGRVRRMFKLSCVDYLLQ